MAIDVKDKSVTLEILKKVYDLMAKKLVDIKSEVNVRLDELNINKVPITRKINNISLGKDIILNPSDIGASADGHNHDERYLQATNNIIKDNVSVPAPKDNLHIVNKEYVDNLVESTKDTVTSTAKLYADSKYHSSKITLLMDDWEGDMQTVIVDGVTVDENVTDVFVCADSSDIDNYNACGEFGVVLTKQMNNAVLFYCDSTPNRDLTVNICVVTKQST